MKLFEMLGEASIVARLSMLVCILPLGAGVAYALRPNEQRLALMRPVSLAALFAGLSGTVVGAMNVLRGISMTVGALDWPSVSTGAAEALVTLFLAFGCLTVGWLCVVAGYMRAARNIAAD